MDGKYLSLLSVLIDPYIEQGTDGPHFRPLVSLVTMGLPFWNGPSATYSQ